MIFREGRRGFCCVNYHSIARVQFVAEAAVDRGVRGAKLRGDRDRNGGGGEFNGREGSVLRGRRMSLVGSVSSLFRLSPVVFAFFVRLRLRVLSCGGRGELVDVYSIFVRFSFVFLLPVVLYSILISGEFIEFGP